MKDGLIPPFRAVRQDYIEGKFYFHEEYTPGSHRWVAWPGSIDGLRELLDRILSHFVETVYVLLKLEANVDKSTNDDHWKRFHGKCRLIEVSAATRAHEDVVLRDGGSQLCVRSNDGEEYLAIDDHGVFYFYSEAGWFGDLCAELGYLAMQRPLIFAEPHWHYRPGGAQEQWEQFIATLGLESVENTA